MRVKHVELVKLMMMVESRLVAERRVEETRKNVAILLIDERVSLVTGRGRRSRAARQRAQAQMVVVMVLRRRMHRIEMMIRRWLTILQVGHHILLATILLLQLQQGHRNRDTAGNHRRLA